MAKAKVKSREKELHEQWIKYFKNIQKENDIIRLIIDYYNEFEIEITKLLEGNNEDKDVSITTDKSTTIQDCELRKQLLLTNKSIVQIEKKLDNCSEYIKNKYYPKFKKLYQYKKILKEVQQQTQSIKPNTNQNRFESLSIKNFKGFFEEGTIQIKPITLIYGPNSYGKSSILQSLLLLNQTVNEGKDYRDVSLLPNGPMVNLGQFKDFLNKNTDEKEIKIELSLPAEHYFDDEKEDIIQEPSILTKLYFSLYFTLEDEKVIIPKIEIMAEQTDFLNPNKPIEKGKEKLYTLKLKQVNQKDEIYEIKQEKNDFLGINLNKNESKKISFFRLEEFTTGNPFEKLEEIIKNIVYVSSFRKSPKRYYSPENNRRRYVGKSGEYTAEILSYDSQVEDKVNYWLKKIAGYELFVKKDKNVNSVNLNDKKTDVNDVNLLDLGSGIAQVLPIITQAFKSEGEMILIEEPEIHLHPKAQADLGEMFAAAIKTREQKKTDGNSNDNKIMGNTFIIETHSENLLLRLEKLIRHKELSKDDVSVIYVDKNKSVKGSHCIRLELDDEGDIINIGDVPNGFFEEGFDELFDISKD